MLKFLYNTTSKIESEKNVGGNLSDSVFALVERLNSRCAPKFRAQASPNYSRTH